jgi:selenocysteine lyase/cysteine desulfurase
LEHRFGAVSFYITNLHFNLGVKLLNDYFGIQVRGGCACAGTYGHYLLNIDQEKSNEIIEKLNQGNLSVRPGWIRLSIHPTMSNEDVDLILDGIEYLAKNHEMMAKDYEYIPTKNIFKHKTYESSFTTDFLEDVFIEKFE